MRGPVVSQPDRRVSATASISASEIAGGWNERNSVRLEESSGIRGEEAYALRGRVRPGDGLLAAAAGREHGPGAVGAAAERGEDEARLAVDPRLDAAGTSTRSRIPGGATRKRVTAPPTRGAGSGTASGSPSAAAIASPFRSTPTAASTSSASWPPPSRAATSITIGPSGPTRSCVYDGPFVIPERPRLVQPRPGSDPGRGSARHGPERPRRPAAAP